MNTDCAGKIELKTHGYYVLRNAVKVEDAEFSRNLCESIVLASRGKRQKLGYPFGEHRIDQGVLFDVLQRHPEFWKLILGADLNQRIQQMFEDPLYIFDNTIVFKSSGEASNEVPYHQDFLSRPDDPASYILWIPLQDTALTDGCLKVFEGSHTQGFYPWHRIKNETHHDRLDDSAVAKLIHSHALVKLEMKVGDALLFHHQLVHGSSEAVRRISGRYALRLSLRLLEDSSAYSPRGHPVLLGGMPPEHLVIDESNTNFAAASSAGPLKKLAIKVLRRMAFGS